VLPERCLEECRAADVVLHAGDVVSLAFWRELERLGRPLHGVHGNMDEPALRQLLPDERVVDVDEARIAMLHVPGSRAGRSTRLRARFPEVEAIVYGHTHVPEVSREQGTWILNPGSPTERRTSPTRAMLVLEVEGRSICPTLIEL
jgi:putative phosphoesterase